MKKIFISILFCMTPALAFALENGNVSQCDAISMYANTSSMGEDEKKIIDIRFHYKSSEIGGLLYWQGDNLDCKCEVYANGNKVEGKTDTLTSYDQHFFLELGKGDMSQIKGDPYLQCELRPSDKKIVVRQKLYFK